MTAFMFVQMMAHMERKKGFVTVVLQELLDKAKKYEECIAMEVSLRRKKNDGWI